MSRLYFSNSNYKDIALNTKSIDMNLHSYLEAFLLLINGLDYDSLSNLCDKMYERYALMYGSNMITKEQCYALTQRVNLDDKLRRFIVESAEECIKQDMSLGTKMSGPYNASLWINHAYYVGECTAQLADILGLDVEVARTYGLLHDYGRKRDQSFNHAIKGYEELVSLGWEKEAVACLTHSFVNGGRCSNNEKAVDGFYVDSNGEPKWREDSVKDDITLFLENYEYNEYDLLLNIADLMAVNKGIVSPYDRIKDIATRRELDSTNRAYFLADITNVLIDFLKQVNCTYVNTPYIRAANGVSIEQIENYFKEVSQIFYDNYLELINSKEKKK